jgi:DNA-binding winged helix-turn-helix (wHTH) protein
MSLCNGPPRVRLGEFTLDREDERLWGERGEVRIGNKAFLVLSRLAEEQGRLVTKDDLFSSVWDGTIVSESALTSVVKELRRALGDDPKQPRYIQSVYGRGYRLIEPVCEADGAVAGPPQRTGGEIAADMAQGAAGYPPLLYLPAFDDAQLAASHPWLGEIIREELLLALSRFRDLRLVSDAAAQGAPQPSQGSGARDYTLSIRLLPDGAAIGVFAKIVRLENQEIIWAEKERLDPEQSARDVDQFIRRIVAAALPRVQDDVTRHLPARTDDAFGIYLRNKLAMRGAESLEEMQAVAAVWEKLIAAHPRFAQAYAPLIYLYNTDFGYTGLGSTTSDDRRRAYALARKAVRLEPSEPYLQTVSAWCHLWAGEAALAREHLGDALELNPFHRDRLLEVATALMFLGELDSAAELLARCETLTPFATGTPHEEVGLLHLLLGRYDKATECLARVAQPTVSSELYALIAAGGLGNPRFPQQVQEWVDRVQQRWRGPRPLNPETLGSWILSHHPFQQPSRREWVQQLLLPALSSALQE